MSNEITAPDGSKWQWKDGEWVKAEPMKGPLGDYVSLHEMPENEVFYLRGYVANPQKRDVVEDHIHVCVGAEGFEYYAQLPKHVTVETNIQPRLSGGRMTAGEAARVPGIVGRWVALKIWDFELSPRQTLRIYGGCTLPHNNYWLEPKQEIILLPEGFGE